MNEAKRNMAPQNSTLINLINDDDDVESITSERLSPIEREATDVEDDCDEEIPIFIGHLPRYVSGINRKTTCNDIIRALIDDELANTKVSKQLICEPQHYTIYERFQDIEHALEGDELIYDLWTNWGDNRNDVQFRLKINKEREVVADEKAKSKKIRRTGIKKLLKKVLHQGEMIQKHLQEIAKPRDFYDESECETQSCHTKWSNRNETDTEDELFLVIESHHNDNDSGVFITKEQQEFFQEMEVDKPNSLETTPKRKFRYSRDFVSLKDHAINSFNPPDDFTRASFKFDLAHQELRSKMNDMKAIIAQEQSFIRKIEKCSFDDSHKKLLETDFEFVDNIEFCDNNATMIV